MTSLEQRRVKIETIRDILEEHEMDDKVILWGRGDEVYQYADAILGIAFNDNCAVVYSREKTIECIMESFGDAYEGEGEAYQAALDHYEYNFVRSLPYMSEGGKKIPPIMVDEVMY